MRQVKDIMTTDVAVITPGATLQEAASIMKDKDVGMLPVFAEAELRGVLTDRDIVIHCVAQGSSPRNSFVQDIMTEDAVYCFEDHGIEEAAALMADRQVRRLIVLDRQGTLAGIVSLGDLATRNGGDRLSGATLERISEASRGSVAA